MPEEYHAVWWPYKIMSPLEKSRNLLFFQLRTPELVAFLTFLFRRTNPNPEYDVTNVSCFVWKSRQKK